MTTSLRNNWEQRGERRNPPASPSSDLRDTTTNQEDTSKKNEMEEKKMKAERSKMKCGG